MDGNRQRLRGKQPGRLRNAADAVWQFLERALTPVDNPLTPRYELPPLPEDDQMLKGIRQSFSDEIFAELLLELPVHRRRIARAGKQGDMDTLRDAVHKLLGAVAYCDSPELEDALRELRLALKTDDPHTIDVYHDRAVNVIDSTLRFSGYRGEHQSDKDL